MLLPVSIAPMIHVAGRVRRSRASACARAVGLVEAGKVGCGLAHPDPDRARRFDVAAVIGEEPLARGVVSGECLVCLLYTSDAADE